MIKMFEIVNLYLVKVQVHSSRGTCTVCRCIAHTHILYGLKGKGNNILYKTNIT